MSLVDRLGPLCTVHFVYLVIHFVYHFVYLALRQVLALCAADRHGDYVGSRRRRTQVDDDSERGGGSELTKFCEQ